MGGYRNKESGIFPEIYCVLLKKSFKKLFIPFKQRVSQYSIYIDYPVILCYHSDIVRFYMSKAMLRDIERGLLRK